MVAAVMVLMPAGRASAHSGPGGEDATSTNYRTRIDDVAPDVEGLTVQVIDTGSRLELRNDTGEEVVVFGYQGEPYLKIDSDGVFENTRSPATYLNRDRDGMTNPPSSTDADAAPSWKRVDGGTTARWHDHRAHWMGAGDPPQVAADPGEPHTIVEKWTIPLRVGDKPVEVVGDLTWVPGPPAWPWYFAMAVVAVALAMTARLRWWRTTAMVAVGVLAVAVIFDVAGDRLAAGDPNAGGLLLPVLTVLLAGAAALMLRRSPDIGALMAAAVGLVCVVVFSAGKLSWLSQSQLPTGVDDVMARMAVAVLAGVGAGVVGLVTLHILWSPSRRQAAVEPAPAPAPAPDGGQA